MVRNADSAMRQLILLFQMRVGEDEAAGHERHAEGDGDQCQDQPKPVQEHLLEGELEHRDHCSIRASTAAMVGSVISSTIRPSARKTIRSA